MQEYQETNDIDIRELIHKDPDDVVERLLQADMVYWEAIKRQVLYPFLHPRTYYGQLLRKLDLERDDIYEYIFNKMSVRKKLKDLRKKQYVLNFILDYVMAHIYYLLDKRSDEDFVSLDSFNGGIDPFPQSEEDTSEEEQLQYDKLHKCFHILWEQNPRRAIVLLLKYVNGLSAREIRSFMNLASETYVNQVVSLAKGNMKKIHLSIEEALKKSKNHIMSDLIDCLGKENPLSRMILEKKRHPVESRQDTGELAENAEKKDRASRKESSPYKGKSFRLIFQADLPESDELFWKAEVLIGDDEENAVDIRDDSVTDVLISGKDGKVISEGTLHLLGLSLKISGGRASCTLGDIRTNLTKKTVYLFAPGYGAVYGHLSF